MNLKNQAFARQNVFDHRKKLRIVLRQLTAGQLTADQSRAIERAVKHWRQYALKLCESPCLISGMLSESGDPATHATATTLFGSLNDPPMALLSHCTGKGGTQNTIYIYLPRHQKEEKQDGS